ncbi:aminotransferase class III-fold pyridoxal phosphate-dependent enzyme [Streptomyces sp. enrichment culture]|uniref:aminotransferase class III-fold pyridoxal phosphate-dependent enzyme n=1 Tax=Streptomyces sp. enrichment culture TaxID=1795815 RepID=UPI003F562A09
MPARPSEETATRREEKGVHPMDGSGTLTLTPQCECNGTPSPPRADGGPLLQAVHAAQDELPRRRALEHFGVEPDIITTAKGLGGSGVQVAAILTNERLTGLDAEHRSFIYGGNLLAAATAAKTLEIVPRPEFLRRRSSPRARTSSSSRATSPVATSSATCRRCACCTGCANAPRTPCFPPTST